MSINLAEKATSGKASCKDEVPSGEENNNNKRIHRFKKSVVRQPKFEGKCEELKGHVHDCADSRQSDQLSETTKEAAKNFGRTCCCGGDARLAIKKLEKPAFAEPQDPPVNCTRTENRIWEKKVDAIVKQEDCFEDALLHHVGSAHQHHEDKTQVTRHIRNNLKQLEWVQ
jgi:hypothetical protein